MAASQTNYMHVSAITHIPPGDMMEIALADDYKEVRGFGKPISTPIMRKMVKRYLDAFESAANLVNKVANDPDYKNEPGLAALQLLINTNTHIASGVFGKEIIQQILAQRDCEGIRYIFGIDDDNKNTVILFGVQQDKDGNGQDRFDARTIGGNSVQVAVSKPLASKAEQAPAEIDEKAANDINGEVHENSRTLAEAKVDMGKRENFAGGLVDHLLSDY